MLITRRISIIVQHFILFLGQDEKTDAASVSIALALRLIDLKNRLWIKQWYKQRPQYTRSKSRERINAG